MTVARAQLLIPILLLVAIGAQAAPPRVALVVPGGDPIDRVLIRELVALIARSGARALAPAEAAASLETDPELASARQRATSLLEQATELARNVRYERALSLLAAAESAAERGLAALVDPRLLADLYLQRGIALLATDAGAAQRWLVRSFQHFLARPLDPAVHAPKILQALRQAARAARGEEARDPPEAILGQAARVLGVQTVLLLRLAPGARARVDLRRFDARRESYAGSLAVSWPSDAGPDDARLALRALSPWFPRADEGETPRRARTSPLAWVFLGAGVAATAAGIGLAVQAQARFDDASALANQKKLLEYAPEARDLEDSGRALRAGSIVCFTLGAAAAVAALVVWQRTRPPREASVRVSVAPAGLRLTY
jgi:hypothetical protein